MTSSRRDFVRHAALAGAAFAFPGAEWLGAAGAGRAPEPLVVDAD